MRGVTVARREARQVLYDTLTRLMPAMIRDNDHFVLPDIPELIERLVEAWREEIGQNRLRRYELEQARAGLETDLSQFRAAHWPEQVERLNRELQQARLERDAANQATADVYEQLHQVRRECADKSQRLEAELEQADRLIVKYEASDQQQKAKTRDRGSIRS